MSPVARSGNSRLTRPGSNTFPNAMPALSNKVPSQTIPSPCKDRIIVPRKMASTANARTRSRPWRRPRRGATRDRTANTSSGSALRSPAPRPSRCRSRWMSFKTGPRLVIGARRLAPIRITTGYRPRWPTGENDLLPDSTRSDTTTSRLSTCCVGSKSGARWLTLTLTRYATLHRVRMRPCYEAADRRSTIRKALILIRHVDRYAAIHSLPLHHPHSLQAALHSER